jgi:hypothetical protein
MARLPRGLVSIIKGLQQPFLMSSQRTTFRIYLVYKPRLLVLSLSLFHSLCLVFNNNEISKEKKRVRGEVSRGIDFKFETLLGNES